MRWIIVFLILYTVPIIVLFRNYKNFKRACIYSSMYVIMVTTIAITNIYVSGINKIEDLMKYQNYAFDEMYIPENDKNKEIEVVEKDNKQEVEDEETKDNHSESKIEDDESKEVETNNITIEEDNDYTSNNTTSREILETVDSKEYTKEKTDMEKIEDFKSDIYTIERKALVPMRECMADITSVSSALKNVDTIKQDLEYASDMCDEVIMLYDEMEVPSLSDEDHTQILEDAKNDVKITYEIRKEAMELGLKLADTKNFKYIGDITDHLKLSDEYIESFKNRIDNIKKELG